MLPLPPTLLHVQPAFAHTNATGCSCSIKILSLPLWSFFHGKSSLSEVEDVKHFPFFYMTLLYTTIWSSENQ
ncbi:hypothetical protein QLX08_000647 [Tetragonisca angustula]|uniref:Uncharacterized protein n=1 Tax=Tetragonisca angustula TaxID=166442 RepID=A0AAW1AHX2_9HYME